MSRSFYPRDFALLFLLYLVFSSIACGKHTTPTAPKPPSGPIWNRQGTVLAASNPADVQNVYEPTLVQPETTAHVLSVPATQIVWKMWFTGGWGNWGNVNIGYAEAVSATGPWVRYPNPVVTGHARPFVVETVSGSVTTYYMYAAIDTQIDVYSSSNGVSFNL